MQPDGTSRPTPERDPQLHYQPTTYPGASLPHAWLQRGQERLSTLDLVGRGRFTLLTGIGGHSWRQVAQSVSEQLGIPIDVVSIGGPNCDAQDVHSRWHALSGVSESGCLLVRPDRHVAWRQTGDHQADQLELVMKKILALEPAAA